MKTICVRRQKMARTSSLAPLNKRVQHTSSRRTRYRLDTLIPFSRRTNTWPAIFGLPQTTNKRVTVPKVSYTLLCAIRIARPRSFTTSLIAQYGRGIVPSPRRRKSKRKTCEEFRPCLKIRTITMPRDNVSRPSPVTHESFFYTTSGTPRLIMKTM